MMSAFLDALGADGPSADRAGKMDLYGRFVGSWISMSGNFPKTAASAAARRMAFWLDAGGPRDPGRLDRAAARRLRPGDAAANSNSSAPRCASTIPISTPGEFNGPIR